LVFRRRGLCSSSVFWNTVCAFRTRIEIQPGVDKMKRVVMTLAAGVVGITIGVAASIPSAYAAAKTKVDCDAVMQGLNGGKKAKEVAKEMNISASSVYRCKKKEMAAAKTAPKAGSEAPAAKPASPANAPKP
jgi:hypothetical protein